MKLLELCRGAKSGWGLRVAIEFAKIHFHPAIYPLQQLYVQAKNSFHKTELLSFATPKVNELYRMIKTENVANKRPWRTVSSVSIC